MNIPSFDIIGKLVTFLGIALILFVGSKYYELTRDAKANTEKLELSDLEYNLVGLEYNTALEEYNAVFRKHSSTILNSERDLDSNKITQAEFNDINSANEKMFIEQQTKYKSILPSLENNYKIKAIAKKKTEALFEKGGIVFHKEVNVLIFFSFIAVVLVMAGLSSWADKEKREAFYKIRENIDKPHFTYNCQSCGRAFNAMIVPAKDGEVKNYRFCSDCYEDGKLKEPDLTLQELKNRTKTYLISRNLSERKIRNILSKLEKLHRWRTTVY
ncbi:MAG: zinc ribbon domain-containing protein [Bacteroidota bacterium]